MTRGIRERINEKLYAITFWGEYAGSITERINSEYLVKEFPDSMNIIYQEYGASHLQLVSKITKSSDLEEIVQLCGEFDMYHRDIADSFGFSTQRRFELENAYLKEFVISDIDARLNTVLDWKNNTLLSNSNKVVLVIRELASECYFETATSVYINVSDSFLDCIIKRLLEEYAATLHASVMAGAEPLIPELASSSF